MKKPQPQRNPENTSLTISLPKSLKSRIETAAKEDRRPVSPWCVIELEKILDQIEAEKAKESKNLALVADTPRDPSSLSIRAPGAPSVKYPAARRRKS